jgi:hypothetical protein
MNITTKTVLIRRRLMPSVPGKKGTFPELTNDYLRPL